MSNKELYKDGFITSTKNETEFKDLVREIRANSRWIPNVQGEKMIVTALTGYGQTSFEAVTGETAKDTEPLDIPEELLNDTLHNGTRLVVRCGIENIPLRDCGYPSMLQTLVGISGPGVSRLWNRNEHMWAKTLNEFIMSQKNDLLVYESCGKISGVFSKSYTPMEIEELISAAETAMGDRLGEVAFEGGVVTHALTTCMWSFPDKEQEIIDAYVDAISAHKSLYGVGAFTPVVKFESSNTGASCANLIPMFKTSSRGAFTAGKAVKIRHDKKRIGGATGCGMSDFIDQAGELLPAFTNGIEVFKSMANVFIANPENAFIGAANWAFGDSLPRKWASNALSTFMDLCGGGVVTMHDIFLGICDISTEAEKAGAPQSRISDISDAIGKFFIRNGNWEEFDVTGTVAWGGK